MSYDNLARSARVSFTRRGDTYRLVVRPGMFQDKERPRGLEIDPVRLAGAADGNNADVAQILADVGAGVCRALVPARVPDEHVLAYLLGFVTSRAEVPESGVRDASEAAVLDVVLPERE